MDKKDRALNILVQVHNSYVEKNLVITRNETIDKYLDLRILQPLEYRKESIELFVNLFFTKICICQSKIPPYYNRKFL